MKAWLKILLLASACVSVGIAYKARPLTDTQYYSESVTDNNNRRYYIIHKRDCCEYKPFFPNRGRILEFTKRLNDQYCSFCFNEDDVELYDAISLYNIRKLKDSWIVPSDEYERMFMRSLDESSRGYEIYYVYDLERKDFVEK